MKQNKKKSFFGVLLNRYHFVRKTNIFWWKIIVSLELNGESWQWELWAWKIVHQFYKILIWSFQRAWKLFCFRNSNLKTIMTSELTEVPKLDTTIICVKSF